MIPSTLHFIWLGPNLPYVYMLGIQSAAKNAQMDRVILHHTEDLSHNPYFESFAATPGVTLDRLDPEDRLRDTGAFGQQLVALYRKLTQPAGKANMIRAAILFEEGGVYLDTDTITLRPLTDFLNTGVFCGLERIVFPYAVQYGKSKMALARAGLLHGVRDVFRRLPKGYRGFCQVKDLYPKAVNNAVFGAQKQHPFVAELLGRMVTLNEEMQLRRYALGTHLLQKMVDAYQEDDMVLHEPEVFYPLGPEISQHWFRRYQSVNLEEILSTETAIVHWYASVRTKEVVPRITPDYIRQRKDKQLFSALASRYALG